MPNATDPQAGSATAAPRPERCGADATGVRAAANNGPCPAAWRYRSFAAGTELFAQDEPNDDVFTVIDGWVSLSHILEDGRRQILDFLLPGDICGFTPPAGGHAPYTAEALTDVTAATVPREQFESRLAVDAAYAREIVGRLSDSISSSHDSLVDIGRRTAIEAVANLLFRLDRRIRGISGAAPGTTVDFPLTQEQLGDALGLSAPHVCRTLRVLRERGILSLRRHRLRIDDPAALGGTVAAGRLPREDAFRIRQTGIEPCRSRAFSSTPPPMTGWSRCSMSRASWRRRTRRI